MFRRERRPVSLDRPSPAGQGARLDREATLPWLPNSLYHFKGSLQHEKNQVKKTGGCRPSCAVAVAGSTLSFPVFGSKCAPVQHMVNILFAVFLGPWYGLAGAFTSSLLRNLMSLGSLMAFPGSMFGALLCGLAYRSDGGTSSSPWRRRSLAQPSWEASAPILWLYSSWARKRAVWRFMPTSFPFDLYGGWFHPVGHFGVLSAKGKGIEAHAGNAGLRGVPRISQLNWRFYHGIQETEGDSTCRWSFALGELRAR